MASDAVNPKELPGVHNMGRTGPKTHFTGGHLGNYIIQGLYGVYPPLVKKNSHRIPSASELPSTGSKTSLAVKPRQLGFSELTFDYYIEENSLTTI